MKHKKQASRSPSTQRKITAKKGQYRISNWPDYNESLVQRGCITLWISTEDTGAWQPEELPKRGGQRRYSDGAIQCLLMVRGFFHLTLRATEGFARSLLELMTLKLAVPDYTTICKRSKELAVCLPTPWSACRWWYSLVPQASRSSILAMTWRTLQWLSGSGERSPLPSTGIGSLHRNIGAGHPSWATPQAARPQYPRC